MVKTCVNKGKEKRNVVSKKFDLNWCFTYLKLMKNGSSIECLTKEGEMGAFCVSSWEVGLTLSVFFFPGMFEFKRSHCMQFETNG